MQKMQKFENMDILSSLEQVMGQHTAFYRDDFEIDKKVITQAASSAQAEDKILLWMARTTGTHCLRERDVFLKDTWQNGTWEYYGEEDAGQILAYAVELTGKKGNTIYGNLYALDYDQHFRHVARAAVPTGTNRIFYGNGFLDIAKDQPFDRSPDEKLGDFLRYEAEPDDPDKLLAVLRQEKEDREKAVPADLAAHIEALHDKRIETEAFRITRRFREMTWPNSPDRTRFAVRVSPYFTEIASGEDMGRLSSLLPYRSLRFEETDRKDAVYALIDQHEPRNVRMMYHPGRKQPACGK